jgi:type VII secretion-associated protein (TIGR03931 family)
VALGGPCAAAVLICPSWWPDTRVERIATAARGWATDVQVRRRAEALPSPSVEVAPDLVVVHADGRPRAIARGSGVLDAVAAQLRGADAVAVDVPAGSEMFGAEVSRALRRLGAQVTVVDDRVLRRVPCAPRDDVHPPVWRRVLPTPRAAAVAVALLCAAALSVAAVGTDAEPAGAGEAAWLVEGRIAVEVPAHWTVERITSGPGSARLQVVSPSDRSDAILVTQSGLPGSPTLEATAETLRAALAQERDGVFTDFEDGGERARRPVVTYREIRADRRIDWTVLLDGGVRIAIGCQGTADRPAPAAQCDRAIRSAHEVSRK